jgi:cation transport regulator ChaC
VTLIDHGHYATLDDPHAASTDETVWGVAYHFPEEHAQQASI